MKKLLYLLLLTPIIYFSSCSKSNVTPQENNNDNNIEETIVGKTWKLFTLDAGWFHLKNDNTYLTKDYLCDTLEEFGTWELDGNVLIFRYTDGPIEYIERNTIISYDESEVKVQADTSVTLDINIIFEVTADVIRGCMDFTFLNFNPNAQCPDTCMNAPVYTDCNGIENGIAAEDDCGDCHQSYIYAGMGQLIYVATYTDTVGVDGMFILAGSAVDIASNPSWNAGCK